MGVFFLDAAADGDFPRLMPFLVIITLSVLIFNLLADLSYAYLDPRIKLD
jgi:peptide/nickel transport system permease protein